MKNSNIEWCHHTFNPWMGCTKVSPGCKYCYAERDMDHRWGRVKWGPKGERIKTSDKYWRQPIKWNAQAEEEGVRYRVFCASLADVFEEKSSQTIEMHRWRVELWDLIRETPYLDWLLLTKRADSIKEFYEFYDLHRIENIWVGVSVENQEQADKRIPELVKIPARIKFLSVEPLIAPVNLELAGRNYGRDYGTWSERVDWVIVGGESGNNARKMHPSWVRSVRDECVAHDTPFLFKQWGEYIHESQTADMEHQIDPDRWTHIVDEQGFAKVGKKISGRRLDGREWNQFP